MQPVDHAFRDPVKQEKSDAFYDPSSADGYSVPSQRVFFDAATGLETGDPGQGSFNSASTTNSLDQARKFRDAAEPGLSPFSSPYVNPASPGSHRRGSSFSSDAVSPPPFSLPTDSGYDAASLQSLGQLGRISLDDSSRSASQQESLELSSSESFYSQNSSPAIGALQSPYGTHSTADSDARLSTFSTDRSNLPQPTTFSTPQLSLGIPTLSVSDTTMELAPVTSMGNMPSINVMAPSPSTPRAGSRQGSHAGFQHLLAQLQAGQQSRRDANAGAVQLTGQQQSSVTWSLGPESYSSPAFVGANGTSPSGFGTSATGSAVSSPNPIGTATPSNNAWAQSQGGDLLHGTGQSARSADPEEYRNEPSLTFAGISGPTSKPADGQGQWSSQAKRQDSYDKIRQFLRLDVDMGFSGGPRFDSPTASGFRKRSNSDVGPRSPIAGMGTMPDWMQTASQAAATSEAQALESVFSTLDWQMPTKRNDLAGPNAGNELGVTSSVAALQLDAAPQMRTMDPSLLSGGSNGLAATSTHVSNPSQLSADGSLPYLQAGHLANAPLGSGINNSPSDAFTMPQPAPSGVGGGPPTQPDLAWRFPLQGSHTAFATGQLSGQPSMVETQHIRRSHSARPTAASHRRGAQSEDLTRLASGRFPQDDFLTSITAPDGGLAPPSTGRSVSGSASGSGAGLPSTSFHSSTTSPRAHPYKINHGRHHSFSSNASNSSAGSAAGPVSPALRGMHSAYLGDASVSNSSDPVGRYSSTALPTYTTLGTPGSASVSSGVGSPGSTSLLAAPPVPLVTSQATQAASASRRKGEALFSCPVPGCGSTFTRQYNLRGHLRSHADERPFKCEWPGCDKSFARAHDCKRHQNLHLNIKPHTCEYCGKTFARLDALNRHHKSDAGGGCSMKPPDGSDQDGAVKPSVSASQNSAAQPVKAEQEPSLSGKAFGGHVL